MDSLRNLLIFNESVWIHLGIHGFLMEMYGFIEEFNDFK